ncbi:8170_t:CDS:2 [Scutellospora calospora]|uniref:8170_t:CDS:1 n=1 Tax=Scutellospora calospora TaxID=85575 RepID=A0ACA9KZQ7_9GLOM|nr:8170_t:CDS:2 [Scutellospora calospora]
MTKKSIIIDNYQNFNITSCKNGYVNSLEFILSCLERLLLIKDAINIVLAILTISNTPKARKDVKRLKEIQITDNNFKYATFSSMIPSILELIEKLDYSIDYSNESNYVNFETIDLVFDDNVGYVYAQKEEEGSPKDRKIKINTPIDNLSDNKLFLAYLLDLRFKKLRFAISTQQLQAKAAFREKYNDIKLLQSLLTLINQPLDIYEEQPFAENSRRQIYQKIFIKLIFTHNTIDEPNDEISHYFSLSEVF